MKNIIRIILISIVTLIISFYSTVFLSSILIGNEIEQLSQKNINLYVFESYMYGIYFTILILITVIIVCTVLLIDHLKKIEITLLKNN